MGRNGSLYINTIAIPIRIILSGKVYTIINSLLIQELDILTEIANKIKLHILYNKITSLRVYILYDIV